jgi:hypothetical protein
MKIFHVMDSQERLPDEKCIVNSDSFQSIDRFGWFWRDSLRFQDRLELPSILVSCHCLFYYGLYNQAPNKIGGRYDFPPTFLYSVSECSRLVDSF